MTDPQENLTRGIGLPACKENGYRINFSPNVKLEVTRTRSGDEEATRVEYHTPVGVVSTKEVINDEMRRAGVSITWVEEHGIERPEDYKVVGLRIREYHGHPGLRALSRLAARIGDDGVAVTMGGLAASPVHHIQKYFIDATEFFFHYKDHRREMRRLPRAIGALLRPDLDLIGRLARRGGLWGANFDDMITYPAYFEADIMPWIRKAADTLGSKGRSTFPATATARTRG